MSKTRKSMGVMEITGRVKWYRIYMLAIILTSLPAVLSASSCVPSVPLFTPGIAVVEGEYVVYLPLCDGEEVHDYAILHWDRDREHGPGNPEKILWEVSDPIGEWQRLGWVVLGRESDFSQVSIEGSNISEWPSEIYIEAYIRNGKGDYSNVGGWVNISDSPQYEIAKWNDVDFLAGDNLGRPQEILKDTDRCANGSQPLIPD